jgi:hypothetical protein
MIDDNDEKLTTLEDALKDEHNRTGGPEPSSDWRKAVMVGVSAMQIPERYKPEPLDFRWSYAALASCLTIAAVAVGMANGLHQVDWLHLDFVWDTELINYWL